MLALLLMVYLAVTIGGQIGTIAHLQREVQAIEADIAELKRKNEVLLNDLRNVKSEYYVDKSARENLGLVRAGETRVIFTPERASGTGQ